MTRCACKGAELSCIIGNIFTELRPPCDMCGGEAVTIHGITPTGHKATIKTITLHRLEKERTSALNGWKGLCGGFTVYEVLTGGY